MMNKIVSILSIAFFLVFTANYVSAESGEESEKWLAENAKEEGVITLPSGLQYKVLRKGDGADYPTVDSPCKCHYKGTLIDGTQFDSSYDRGTPATFAPNQVRDTIYCEVCVTIFRWKRVVCNILPFNFLSLYQSEISNGHHLIFHFFLFVDPMK